MHTHNYVQVFLYLRLICSVHLASFLLWSHGYVMLGDVIALPKTKTAGISTINKSLHCHQTLFLFSLGMRLYCECESISGGSRILKGGFRCPERVRLRSCAKRQKGGFRETQGTPLDLPLSTPSDISGLSMQQAVIV